MDSFTLIALTLAVFLTAGTIKGIVGLGLPTTAIGLMTLYVDPRSAVAVILFPMLLSNAWQVYRLGDIGGAFRRYLPFAVALFFGVGATAMLTRDAPDRVLIGVLGAVILLFVGVNWSLKLPPLPNRWDRIAQISIGLAAGGMGGLTAVWAPPMALYLTARHVGKDEFVRATGLLIFVGSIPLCVSYAAQGVLTWRLGLVSLLMLIPTFAGFTLGEALRARLSTEKFRAVLLWVFLILGLNLLRRALFVG